MSEKIIGSLIYGDHVVPKKQRPWKQRIVLPLSITILVLLIVVGAYKFINYREESSVQGFLKNLRNGNYDTAYANWDISDGHYSMKQFMEDWGKDGYYGKALATAKISDSNSKGPFVIVYIKFQGFKAPVSFLVDKETLKISFSTVNKYVKTQKSVS
jgi:hypothetical protein